MKGIPSFGPASRSSGVAFAIPAGSFWLRRRSQEGAGGGSAGYGYGKLPTADGGSSSVADTQLEVEMRAPGGGPVPVRGSKDDGSYGSL